MAVDGNTISGVVVAQIHPREDVALDLAFLEEYDRRRYGSVEMIFYASAEELAAEKAEDAGDEVEDDFEDGPDEDGGAEEEQ